MKGWIEIFRSGKHTSSLGKEREWTNDDLDKMVNSYSANDHEAPLVVGHPQSNDPAFGWVDQVKRSGDVLLAKFKQVAPEFAELVKSGRFKKRSISVYPNGSLRHVGFLGAQPPAIKGLRNIEFSYSDAEIYEFAETMEATMPTVEELQKQLEEEKKKREEAEKARDQFKDDAEKAKAETEELQADAKNKEINDFVESGIDSGKILPAWKDQGISEFMQGLNDDEQTYEFSEGKQETRLDWFKNFISSFSEHPLFKEMVPPQKDETEQNDDFGEAQKIADEMAEDHRVEQ